MQSLWKGKAVADDHDDIESSQENTWSRQNHGGQPIKPRKRRISNATAPPPKVRQRKTHMEKCADYEFQSISMMNAAQRVVDIDTPEDLGPPAKTKELEARAASLHKTAMAKMEGFLQLNPDWMSLASDFTGLSMSDSETHGSNDPKDLITQVGLFSAATGDRSSTIQYFKQKGDEIMMDKERTRALVSELNEYKEKWAATRKVEQRLRNERDALRRQISRWQNPIESIESDDERSAPHIHKLKSDLQQSQLDLVAASSEIDKLKSALARETTEHSKAMHHHRSELRALDSARIEVQMDRDEILADKIGLEKDREGLLFATVILEKENDCLLSKRATMEEERDRLLSENTTLQGERDSLISERTTLQEEKDVLLNEKTTLYKERDDLLSGKSRIQRENDYLRSQTDQFKQEIDNLRSKNAYLEVVRTDLESQKNRLEKERRDQSMGSLRGRIERLTERDKAQEQ